MEVRLQEREVDRSHPLHRRPTHEHLAGSRSQGIRLLFERESNRRSSALEPGQRTPPRRIPKTPNADVQWIRSSGEPLLRHGPEKELLGICYFCFATCN